jgi:beta-lactamase regulating signal transducer with metallopeptidase domain
MNAIFEQFGLVAREFVRFSSVMLVQSTVLTAVLLLVEFVLRKKVRAVIRYWLVMVVFAHLALAPILSLRIISQDYWPGAKAAYARSAYIVVDEAALQTQVLSEALRVEQARPTGYESSVTWELVVFLLWIVTVIAMVLLLATRVIGAKKNIAQAARANFLMDDILVYCRKCLGVREHVRLKIFEGRIKPVVAGLLQPVIVIPRDLAPTLGSRHLRAALFHQLAHVKRHDLWANWAQNILQILYFYNPIMWLAGVTARRLREQAADETVLDIVGRRHPSYTQLLADVVKLTSKRRDPGLNLIGVP